MQRAVTVSAPAVRRLLIRPNGSLSSTAALAIVVMLGVLTLGIAVGFWLVGAWLVLPFAGLELAAVATGFYLVARRQGDFELLVIDDAHVELTQRKRARRRHYRFPRYWTNVWLEPGTHRWYPSRLTIGSHGRRVEIGSFVTDDERQELSRQIVQLLRPEAPQATASVSAVSMARPAVADRRSTAG